MNAEKLEHQVIFICGGMRFLILNLFQFVPWLENIEKCHLSKAALKKSKLLFCVTKIWLVLLSKVKSYRDYA